MPKRPPRVLIVYNQPVLPPDHPDAASESDILETVGEVEKVLPAERYQVSTLGYARDPRELIRRVRAWKPHVVFNLFEGEADHPETEVYHAGLLEWLQVPYTGSRPGAMALGRDKVRTKQLLLGAGLPTAAFQMVERPGPVEWRHPWPAIVKPACQDASVGIDQGSVVESATELTARVRHVFDRYGGPVLVEQYLAGREFHVHVLEDPHDGRLVIPPATEIRFQSGTGFWPIYTYEGKWNEKSAEYQSTPLDTGIALPEPLRGPVEEVCRAAYRLIGMRDYGRVDLRVTPDGRPHVLEVNPNPYLNSIALVEGLKGIGQGYPEFIQGMVAAALARAPRKPGHSGR